MNLLGKLSNNIRINKSIILMPCVDKHDIQQLSRTDPVKTLRAGFTQNRGVYTEPSIL